MADKQSLHVSRVDNGGQDPVGAVDLLELAGQRLMEGERGGLGGKVGPYPHFASNLDHTSPP